MPQQIRYGIIVVLTMICIGCDGSGSPFATYDRCEVFIVAGQTGDSFFEGSFERTRQQMVERLAERARAHSVLVKLRYDSKSFTAYQMSLIQGLVQTDVDELVPDRGRVRIVTEPF